MRWNMEKMKKIKYLKMYYALIKNKIKQNCIFIIVAFTHHYYCNIYVFEKF